MARRLGVWWYVERMQEYPRTVHFFYDDEFKSFQAEVYTSQHISRDSEMIYEDTLRANDLSDLVAKVVKYFGDKCEIDIRYDAGDIDNR